MQSIVDSLCDLQGIRHAAIYRHGEFTYGQLTQAQKASFKKSSLTLIALFLVVEARQAIHNEIFISVDNGYIAGFLLGTGDLALLITERDINFSAINDGIQSASEAMKQLVTQEVADIELLVMESMERLTVLKATNALLPILDDYTALLTTFIGPASNMLMDEALEVWKKNHVPSIKNLPYLLTLLGERIEPTQERNEFIKAAEKITPSPI